MDRGRVRVRAQGEIIIVSRERSYRNREVDVIVILNKVKNLDRLMDYKSEILRLWPQDDTVTDSRMRVWCE